MDNATKAARKRLKEATRKEYEIMVMEAKLTPLQEEILRRHILCGHSICKISMDIHRSDRSIKENLKRAYMGIGKIIKK